MKRGQKERITRFFKGELMKFPTFFIYQDFMTFHPYCECGCKMKKTWDGLWENIFTCYDCKKRFIVTNNYKSKEFPQYIKK